MKSVLLIRHAKSSWDDPHQKDFDRTLNERGKKDAPVMAQRLRDKKIPIDAFISSPAKRALSTAKFFVHAYHQKEKDIIIIDALYEAPYDVFFEVISKTSNEYNTIAIFAHNPGITMFANQLTNTRIDNMPTCAIFAVKAEIHKWDQFEKEEKTFWFFDYPKG